MQDSDREKKQLRAELERTHLYGAGLFLSLFVIIYFLIAGWNEQSVPNFFQSLPNFFQSLIINIIALLIAFIMVHVFLKYKKIKTEGTDAMRNAELIEKIAKTKPLLASFLSPAPMKNVKRTISGRGEGSDDGLAGRFEDFCNNNLYRYDLRLMSVATPDDLADKDRSLVIVAFVGADLHIRIFDASGKKVVDKAEDELVSGETLIALKQRLDPFPDERSLSQDDKQEIIGYATSIAGHTHLYSYDFRNFELNIHSNNTVDFETTIFAKKADEESQGKVEGIGIYSDRIAYIVYGGDYSDTRREDTKWSGVLVLKVPTKVGDCKGYWIAHNIDVDDKLVFGKATIRQH